MVDVDASSTRKLKLARLPDRISARIVVTVPADLKQLLLAYAELYRGPPPHGVPNKSPKHRPMPMSHSQLSSWEKWRAACNEDGHWTVAFATPP